MGNRTLEKNWGLGGIGVVGYPDLDGRAQAHVFPPRENQVLKPSEMIAFADSALYRVSNDDFPAGVGLGMIWLNIGLYDPALSRYPVDPADQLNVTRMRTLYGRRHSGKFNVIFCDGHIESGRPQLFFDFWNAEVNKRWNFDD